MRFHIDPSSLARYVDRHCVSERHKGDVIRLALAHFAAQDLDDLEHLKTAAPRHPFPLYGESAQERNRALADLVACLQPDDVLIDVTRHEAMRREIDAVLHLVAYATRAPAIRTPGLTAQLDERFKDGAEPFSGLLSMAADVTANLQSRRTTGFANWLISDGRMGIYRLNGDDGATLEAASIGAKPPSIPDDSGFVRVSIRDMQSGATQAILTLDRLWIVDVITPINWLPRDGKRRYTEDQTYDILPYIDSLRGDVLKAAHVARASIGGVAMMELRQATLLDGRYAKGPVRFSIVDGTLSSIGGEPALSIGDHRREWRHNGRLHRESGPSIVRSGAHEELLASYPYLESAIDLDRDFITELPIKDRWHTFAEEYYREGRLHRADGPALTGGVDGMSAFLFDGQLHAVDGPAMQDDRGLEIHAQEGVLHRDEGYAVDIPGEYRGSMLYGKYMPIGGEPTIVSDDGRRTWMENGRVYRTDGPTVIHPDGTEEWAVLDADGKVDPFGSLETRSPSRTPTPMP